MKMLRKYLFLALTAMLLAVIGSLILQSRRKEAQAPPAAPPAAAVRTAKPTPTRVGRPADLQIVQERVSFGPAAADGTVEARHVLVIRNSGRVAYRNIAVDLAYLGSAGQTVETRRRALEATLAAGGELSANDVVEAAVPAAARKARASIAYADIEPPAR